MVEPESASEKMVELENGGQEDVFDENGKLRPLHVRLYEVLVNFAPLGLVAFGGPAAHIGILSNAFVERKKWLDSEKFVELLAVGQGLPGPTSTQMVISLGAIRAGIPGGLLAFTLWNIPSFIVLVTVAMISRSTLDASEMPDYLKGLAPAATALVFIAAYNLGINVCSHSDAFVQKLKIGLATLSAMATILVTADSSVINPRWASLAFPVFLILGGSVTLLHSRQPGNLEHYFKPPTEEEAAQNRSILKHINISPFMGIAMLVAWLGILGTVVGLRAADMLGEYGQLFESFFRIGSIIYGGGQVVLPMLLTEVVTPGWVSEPQFFQGFALVQSLPGPLFNFSSFLGAIYKSIPGAFIAWVGLFGPGILLIFAFLPFWMKVRKVAWFKCFLAGVNAAAIGLIIAACPQLYFKAVQNWASVAVFLFTGSLVKFYNVFVPVAILLGGLLGFLLTPTVIGYGQTF